MRNLIQIQNTFTDVEKEKILRSVGASISENLLHSVQFGKKSLFALCENQFFWHCEFNETKIDFECYESQGKIDRNKNLLQTISFEDKTETFGRRKKSFTTLTIKNDLLTRRFDLDFVLTDEEKTALKYFFDCYFKDDPVSENFKLPKEKIGRVWGLEKEAFVERVDNFFGKTEKSEQEDENSSAETTRNLANLTESESKTEKIEKKSIGGLLNLFDFLADIAFLFATVCLLKSDFLKIQVFDEKFSMFNIFDEYNVLKIYTFISAGIFILLKFVSVLFSRNPVKIAGVLVIAVQIVTLFLISPIMKNPEIEIIYLVLFFTVLNLLLYFCFQMLVGNVFSTAIQKFISLVILGIILYFVFAALETISSYEPDLSIFAEKLLKNLNLK